MSRLSWFPLGYRTRRSQPKAGWARLCVAGAVLGVMFAGFAQGQQAKKELRVAAAADLQPVLPVLAERYEKATGVKLAVSLWVFGNSGNADSEWRAGGSFSWG